jgi:V/A-type H+-transporting ATPase subunit D
MAANARNKTTLGQRQRELRAYRQVLPSLDLKRRQLASLLLEERRALAEREARLDSAIGEAAARLPMLAAIDEARLVQQLAGVDVPVALVSTLGVALPVPAAPPRSPVETETWATPAWYDAALAALSTLVALRREIEWRRERVARLAAALRRTVQRVNLFELQLIPATAQAVREIHVFLADLERAAIVRAKGARSRRQRAAMQGSAEASMEASG